MLSFTDCLDPPSFISQFHGLYQTFLATTVYCKNRISKHNTCILIKWLKRKNQFPQSQKPSKNFLPCLLRFCYSWDTYCFCYWEVWSIHWHRATLSKQLQPPCISLCLNTSSNPVFILASEKDWIGALLKTTLGPEFSILDVNIEIFLAALSTHNHEHVIFLFWTY